MSEYKEYTVRVYKDRTEYLNSKGQLHREDGPAVENSNEDKYWYLNGNCHRENGPAIEYSNGDKCWFLNNQFHREDGPAVEYANGSKYWYLNGKLHREDGPAREYADGSKEWWLNGKKLTEAEFNKRINKTSCAGKVVEVDGKKYKLTEDWLFIIFPQM